MENYFNKSDVNKLKKDGKLTYEENINESQRLKINGSPREKIANGVNTKWIYAEEIRQLCIKNAPELGPWPEIPLIRNITTSSNTPELTKVLPFEKYIAIISMLKEACNDGIQESFAGAGLALLGLRVGESTALKIGNFEFNGNLGRYYVENQIDDKGAITDKLKNEYSYRYCNYNSYVIFKLLINFILIKSY